MSNSNSERLTGQVKWFNTKAGYGFITVCDGEHKGKDIFVHFSSVKVTNSQYRYLVQGEYLDFNIVKPEGDKYEFHAVEVSGVKGGPIMCETRRLAQESQPQGSVRKYKTVRPNRKSNDSSTTPAAASSTQGEFKKVSRKRPVRNEQVNNNV